jgi:S1-C subfamily serine protease
MIGLSKFFRRTLVVGAALLASTAALGFSQSAQGSSNANPGHPSEPGALVISVLAGSPAQKAGLARGDIILDVNGSAVNSQRDVRDAITAHKKGETVSVTVRHGDAQKTLSVALGERDGRAYLGVLLLPDRPERTGMLGPGREERLQAFSQGALVAGVASGGPADKAGIRRGDVILSVDGVDVSADHNLSALIQDRKIGDTVTLSVTSLRGPSEKAPREVKVTLGSTPDKKKPWLGVEYRMGFPTAFLAPWGEQPPAADLQMPGLGGAQPDMPALPGLGTPRAPAPVM